jgi:hypothetical protein
VDILAWLRELGLDDTSRRSGENEIAADILPKLTAEDLKDIGVIIVGRRRKLLETGLDKGRWKRSISTLKSSIRSHWRRPTRCLHAKTSHPARQLCY